MTSQITWEMTANEAKAIRAIQKLINKQAEAARGAENIEKKTKKSAAAQQRLLGGFKEIAGALGMGALGIGSAIAVITGGMKKWLDYQKDISKEITNASYGMVAFSMLQEGGEKAARVRAAADLGARYGISDLGQILSIVQGQQSVSGSFEQGMINTEEMLKAHLSGMKLESVRKLALLAPGQHLTVKRAIELIYAAGQASGQEPDTLAGGTGAWSAWRNKEAAAAAMALMAESKIEESKVEIYTQKLGTALGAEDGSKGKFLKSMGIVKEDDELVRMDKLYKGLIKGGYDPTKITQGDWMSSEFGNFGEREAFALQTIMTKYKSTDISKGFTDKYQTIMEEAQPGKMWKDYEATAQELADDGLWNMKADRAKKSVAAHVALAKEGITIPERESLIALINDLDNDLAALRMRREGQGYLVGDDGKANAFTEWVGYAIKKTMADTRERINMKGPYESAFDEETGRNIVRKRYGGYDQKAEDVLRQMQDRLAEIDALNKLTGAVNDLTTVVETNSGAIENNTTNNEIQSLQRDSVLVE